MSCIQLSEGGSQVAYPFGMWSRSFGDVHVLFRIRLSKSRSALRYMLGFTCVHRRRGGGCLPHSVRHTVGSYRRPRQQSC